MLHRSFHFIRHTRDAARQARGRKLRATRRRPALPIVRSAGTPGRVCILQANGRCLRQVR